MYKVRFHLANGPHYMHWQIKDSDGNIEYIDPEKYSLWLIGCKLKNNAGTAKKIFEGADKTVCAWIECKSWHLQSRYSMSENMLDAIHMEHIEYNPHKQPYWSLLGMNMDGKECNDLVTHGRRVYQIFN
jgi:hypothetical protein